MERLALLSQSFISSLLLETLRSLNIPVYAPFPLPVCLNTLDETTTRAKINGGGDQLLLYTNAEDCLPLVVENSPSESLVHAIGTFKEKGRFRRLLRGLEPPLYVRELDRDALESFSPPKEKDLVLKPSVGFLSLGIRQVSDRWPSIVREVKEELREAEKIFPACVVGSKRFLVEEYIRGKEYACDGYFDDAGKPVILGIYHHLFEKEEDTRDLLYTTDLAMNRTLAPKVSDFLRQLGERIVVRNFPFHLEFRTSGRHLRMIELNPMRFGGFGLADLNHYAFGINSYHCFLTQQRPDFDRLPEDPSCYAFVLGRVPQSAKGRSPDHAAFRATFSNVLDYSSVNHRRYPCFSRVVARGASEEDFERYLHMDFSRYFR